MSRTERGIAGAVLIAVVAAADVGADSVLAQDRTSCAQIAAAAERLACYDRASPPTETVPLATGPASSPPVPAGEPSQTATVAVPTELESEQREAVPVVIIGMRKYPGRSATFTTDDGEVWVQVGAEGVYLPKVPFKAELRPASMGTYFLRPSDYGWRVHVRRDD